MLLAPLRAVATLALPPRCPACGVPVAEDHRFCSACWGQLVFLGPPWCAGCNLPFGHDRGGGALCGECLEGRPRHAGVRAAVAYGEVARQLALKLKYGRRMGLATTAARLMARGVPRDAEVLVPVPLHRWRLWSRGYNQAVLIADALGRATGVAVAREGLVRTRATTVLKGLGRRERARALAGAFAVKEAGRPELAGRHVVLVDDVHTSGATAEACSAALLRGGAAKVTVVCWARVIGTEVLDGSALD